MPDISELQARSKIEQVDFLMDEIISNWKLEIAKPVNIYTKNRNSNPEVVEGTFEEIRFYAYSVKGMSKDPEVPKPLQPLIFVRNDGHKFFNPLLSDIEYDQYVSSSYFALRVFEKYPNLCILYDTRNGSLFTVNLTSGALLSCNMDSKIFQTNCHIDLMDDDVVHNGITGVVSSNFHIPFSPELKNAAVAQTFYNWACKPYYCIVS